jgi:hypothetical protein
MPGDKQKDNQWTFVSKEELDKIMTDSFTNNVKLNQDVLLKISSGVDRFLKEQQKNVKKLS